MKFNLNHNNLASYNDLIHTIIETQNSNYMILYGVLAFIVTATIGSSFFWNFYLAKKTVEQEVENKVEEKLALIKEEIKTFKESTKKNLNKNIEVQIKEKTINLNIEVARLYSILSFENGEYFNSLHWAFSWLEGAAIMNSGGSLNGAVMKIKTVLEEKSFNKFGDETDFTLEDALKKCELIPDVLVKEKAFIRDELKNFHKRQEVLPELFDLEKSETKES